MPGTELGAWSLELGAWSLELGAWSVELGAWSVELGAWSLELGAWTSGSAAEAVKSERGVFTGSLWRVESEKGSLTSDWDCFTGYSGGFTAICRRFPSDRQGFPSDFALITLLEAALTGRSSVFFFPAVISTREEHATTGDREVFTVEADEGVRAPALNIER